MRFFFVTLQVDRMQLAKLEKKDELESEVNALQKDVDTEVKKVAEKLRKEALALETKRLQELKQDKQIRRDLARAEAVEARVKGEEGVKLEVKQRLEREKAEAEELRQRREEDERRRREEEEAARARQAAVMARRREEEEVAKGHQQQGGYVSKGGGMKEGGKTWGGGPAWGSGWGEEAENTNYRRGGGKKVFLKCICFIRHVVIFPWRFFWQRVPR